MASKVKLFALLLAAASVTASAQHRARITQPVDDRRMHTLKGNVHPLARSENDQGAAESSLPMDRMMLVLRHSDEQESALKQLIDQQQDAHSPNFHQWLTPQQYAEKFGPADEDIATVSSWLQSQGFQGIHVNAGHTTMEFSGDAAKVNRAFHTSIHHYRVHGNSYTANATDPAIPEALTPVVAGISSLNNFPHNTNAVDLGRFRRDPSTGKSVPLPGNTQPQPLYDLSDGYYALGPTDIATIYNALPLWNAGTPINGTGQTIAIVGNANVIPADVVNFRQLFGLPLGDTTGPTGTQYFNLIYNAGSSSAVAIDAEATLDVEWSGAMAPGATVDYVTSAVTNVTDGLDLSVEYIIDNNLAPVMNLSFGVCELGWSYLGRGSFYNTLYQQAAAQGITVSVATGDNGSGDCDVSTNTAQYGLQVNGIASSPYDVAVGGTDFNLNNNPALYFSATNDPTSKVSALGYIPETVWNSSCGNPLYAVGPYVGETPEQLCNNSAAQPQYLFNIAGGGGVSHCTVSDGFHQNSCSGGYAKPSWQTGTGVPADGLRDMPDVSLFGSNGMNGVFYVVCIGGGLCDLTTNYGGVGGTSVASPVFAGIMALVNQKTGMRQGNANYVLYALANAQSASSCNSSTGPASSCVFNDITYGSNAVPCATGTPDCVTTTGGNAYGLLGGYSATSGYDLASGLGSINIANLVNNWNTVVFNATTTTLGLTPTTITHGASVTANVSVSSSAGTPTGNFSINGDAPSGSVGMGTLASGSGSLSFNTFPGGTYNVTAHYGGDGTYASSDSAPVSLTVTPENTTTTTGVFLATASEAQISNTSYGIPVGVRMSVAGGSGYGTPTGTFTLTNNGSAFMGGTFTLSPIQPLEVDSSTLAPGSYSFVTAYSGDNSFNASTSSAAPLTVTKHDTKIAVTSDITTVPVTGSATVTATMDTFVLPGIGSSGNGLTGTITLTRGTTTLGTASITPHDDASSFRGGIATFTVNGSQLALTANTLTATYAGDTNYNGSSGTIVLTAILNTSTTTVSAPSSARIGDTITLSASVSPTSPVPTGTVQFTVDGTNAGSPVTLDGTGTATYAYNTTLLGSGTHTIGAVYSGDADFLPGSAITRSIAVLNTQTITFPQPASPAGFGVTASETLTATASSGLGISYAVSGPATLSGTTLTFTGTGTVTVTASQAGNSQYAAAAPVMVTIAVETGQAISFSALPAAVVYMQTVSSTLSATGGASGNPVTFSVTGPASVSGNTLTYTGTGTVVVTANQAGDSTYAPAPSVSQVINVLPVQSDYVFSSTLNVASAPQSVVLNFTSAGTLNSTTGVQVVTNGATNLDFTLASSQPTTGGCINGATFSVGGSCTVNVVFTPLGMNQRYGAVVLKNSSGAVVATAYLSGTVSGPIGVFNASVNSSYGSVSAAIGISLDSANNAYVTNGNSTGGVTRVQPGCTNPGTCQNSIGTGISLPYSPAIDGAGNIYVSSYGNGNIGMLAAGCTSTCTTTNIGTGLIVGRAVTVDTAGNVYVMNDYNGSTTDASHETLLEITPSCRTCMTTRISGDFNNPFAMVTDNAGNVYIADYGKNRVVEVPTTCSSTTCEVILASSNSQFVSPTGIALDPAGNLYVSATTSLGSGILYELPVGCVLTASSTCQMTIASGSIASGISGVAIDGSGNIIATANQSKSTLQKFDRTQTAALTFPTTGLGGTSATQTVSFQNVGNQNLNFSAISVPNGFTLNGSTCSTNSPLAPGSVCTFNIAFTPTASSVNSGTLSITDDNLGTTGTVQSVTLSGTVSSLYGTSVSLSISPSTGITVGQTAVITAFLSPTSEGGFTPGGSITFSDGSTTLCSNIAFNSSGVATCNATLGTIGSRTLSAVYSGDTHFLTSTGTLAITVLGGSQTITFPAPVSPVQYISGTPVHLTATASSGLVVSYTVTGPATLSGSTVTYTGTGTVVITAHQAGNANYAAAPDVSQTVVVVPVQLSYTFLATAVGSASFVQTITLNFYATATLNANTTKAIQPLTAGAPSTEFILSGSQPATGACTAGATYNNGDTCSVNINFLPRDPGQRKGAVVLYDSSATPLAVATAYISGVGNGPQAILNPGAVSSIPGAITGTDIAVDDLGDIFMKASGNALYELPIGCNNAGCRLMLTTSIGLYSHLAVDPSGAVYFADGSSNLVKIPLGCQASSCFVTVASGLPNATGIAVDGSGNVYVAILPTVTGNGYTANIDYIVKIAPGSTPVIALTGGFADTQIAVDAVGNLYYGENLGSATSAFKAASTCHTIACVTAVGTVTGGAPEAVAVDGVGNVYIASTGGAVIEVPVGCTTASCQITLTNTPSTFPLSLFVDRGGNVYVGDDFVIMQKIARTVTPALVFASTAAGVTSAEQSVTLYNNGNQPLNIASLVPSADYALAGDATCATGQLVAEAACNLSIVFAPIAAGTRNGTFTVTDNSFNVTNTTQVVMLNGTATKASTTLVLATPVAGAGNTYTLTATLSPASISTTAATGSIAFLDGGTAITGCGSVSFNTSGVAVCTTPALAGGSHTLTTSYAGDTNFSAATSNMQTVTITLAQTISFPQPLLVVYGTTSTVSLTATASSALAASYTVSGPATVSGSTLTITGPGTVLITANQAGDSTYAAAAPVSRILSVAAPVADATLAHGTPIATPVTVTVSFSSGFTLGSITVTTNGSGNDFAVVTGAGAGTCFVGTAYGAGDHCMVAITFTPSGAGLVTGTVNVLDNSATPAVQGTADLVSLRYR